MWPAAVAGVLIAASAVALCYVTTGCSAEPVGRAAPPPRADWSSTRPMELRKEKPMSIPVETTRRVEHVDETDFAERVLESGVPVLVDFYADWCMPCRMLGPVLDELARETPGAKIVKVNVDESPRLAAKYSVSSIPFLVLFKDGRPVARHLGLANKSALRTLLSR
jgi:thioredoxin 1